MIGYAADVNRTLKGLSAIVERQHPLIKLFVDNWPLTAAAGAALGVRYWRQYKSNNLSFWGGVQDAGIVISPLVGLFLLQKIAEEKHVEQNIAKLAYSAGDRAGSAAPVAIPPQQVPASNGGPLPTSSAQPLQIVGKIS